MTDTLTHGPQVGRSLPRLEAKGEGHRPRRICACLRVPACCTAKSFAALCAWRASIDRRCGRARDAWRLSRRHHRRCQNRHSRSVSTDPPSTISRSSPMARCTISASRSRWCSPTTRMSRKRPRKLDRGRYDELPAVFDEVEAPTNKIARARRAQARARLSPTSNICKGKTNTNVALDFESAARRCGQGLRAAEHVFEHTFRTQKVLHLPLEPLVSIADPTARRRHHPHLVAGTVLRAHRDRAAARLAGKPRAREGAVSRRRLRREALYQDGSDGASRCRCSRAGR